MRLRRRQNPPAAIYPDDDQQQAKAAARAFIWPPNTACPLMARQMEPGDQHASEWQIPILIDCGE